MIAASKSIALVAICASVVLSPVSGASDDSCDGGNFQGNTYIGQSPIPWPTEVVSCSCPAGQKAQIQAISLRFPGNFDVTTRDHLDSGTIYSDASGSSSGSWSIVKGEGVGETRHISVSVKTSSSGNLNYGVNTLCASDDTDAPVAKHTKAPSGFAGQPCSADFGSNSPCCGQGGPVRPEDQCSSSQFSVCVGYKYNQYYGHCEDPSTYYSPPPFSSGPPLPIAEIAGGVGGGVALIVAAVVIAIVIRRRRQGAAASAMGPVEVLSGR